MDDIFDKEGLLARMGGNEAILPILLGKFKSSSSDSAQKIEQLIKENSIEDATREAHSLKGVGANLCLPQITAIVAVIEQNLRDNEIENAQKMLPSLQKAIDDVLAIL